MNDEAIAEAWFRRLVDGLTVVVAVRSTPGQISSFYWFFDIEMLCTEYTHLFRIG